MKTIRPIRVRTTCMRETQITVTEVPVTKYCLFLLRQSLALRIQRKKCRLQGIGRVQIGKKTLRI